jgi:hypothetical protein
MAVSFRRNLRAKAARTSLDAATTWWAAAWYVGIQNHPQPLTHSQVRTERVGFEPDTDRPYSGLSSALAAPSLHIAVPFSVSRVSPGEHQQGLP